MRINSFLGLIILTFALTAVSINSSFALKELNIPMPIFFQQGSVDPGLFS